MRILGIDPGYATIGYGIVEYNNFKFKTIAYGAVTTTPDKLFSDRLCDIYNDIRIHTFTGKTVNHRLRQGRKTSGYGNG